MKKILPVVVTNLTIMFLLLCTQRTIECKQMSPCVVEREMSPCSVPTCQGWCRMRGFFNENDHYCIGDKCCCIRHREINAAPAMEAPYTQPPEDGASDDSIETSSDEYISTPELTESSEYEISDDEAPGP